MVLTVGIVRYAFSSDPANGFPWQQLLQQAVPSMMNSVQENNARSEELRQEGN
jgi:N-acetyl-anhydromuramyl-L-alanine amidase AmpD